MNLLAWAKTHIRGSFHFDPSDPFDALSTTAAQHDQLYQACFVQSEHMRPYPQENTGSRPLSLSQARERLISSWVGDDQRIPAVACFLFLFFLLFLVLLLPCSFLLLPSDILGSATGESWCWVVRREACKLARKAGRTQCPLSSVTAVGLGSRV